MANVESDDTVVTGFDFVYNQRVDIRQPALGDDVWGARVLDTIPDPDSLSRHADCLVLRLADPPREPPGATVELAFGHKSWLYRGDVGVRAFFGPCWFLSRPEPVTTRRVQRRQFVRIRYAEMLYALNANVRGEPEGEPFGLYMENLSASGCRGVPDRADVAEYVLILLSLFELGTAYVMGRVIHRIGRPDGRVTMGISFDGIGRGLQDDLARKINDEIRRALQKGHDITV